MSFIEDTFPLLVWVAPIQYDEQSVQELLSRFEECFKRGDRYALLSYATKDTGNSGPMDRKQLIAWADSPRVRRFSAELCVGAVSMVPSALARGAITALLWLWKPPCPFTTVSTLEQGVDWCLGQLEEADVKMSITRPQVHSLLRERLE